MTDKVMKAILKEFDETGFGNQARIPGGKYGAKRVELKDWLVKTLSQATAEARERIMGEMGKLKENRYWITCEKCNQRTQIWADGLIIDLLSHLTNQLKEKKI